MGLYYEDERSSSESDPTTEHLLGSASIQLKATQTRKHWPLLAVIFNLCFLSINVVAAVWLSLASASSNSAYKATSSYSPLFDQGFSLHLDDINKDPDLWGTNESTSIYIQDPSPEVDAAWDYISAASYSIITVDSNEVRRLGRDPAVVVKAPLDWGVGDDAYPAQIDVFHEIHCLDMLRKEMYWDHYYRPIYGEPENADYLHVRHKRHCLRIILRTLMCNADVDIVTHNWRHGSYRPIADFDNPRQCRDFRQLLDWSMQHAVADDMEKWRTIQRPTDAVILPRPTPNLYTSEDSEAWINAV